MNDRADATAQCCAECGEEGGVSLKVCKACMQAKYCNAKCQRKHWATHKADCKRRAAELRDEALFKDPTPKEECPICFLPMPERLICCVSLPPATTSSVPIYDFGSANEDIELSLEPMEEYYPCCGKSICKGCVHSCRQSGNHKCPYCNSDRSNNTEESCVEELMRRVGANDAASIYMLAGYYYRGQIGLQQDRTKATELFTRAAERGCSKAHNNLAGIYHDGGALKKAKFHLEAAAMAGDEAARSNLGILECNSGNMERSTKHWTIAASAGCYIAMHELFTLFKKGGYVSRESIDSTLAAYNNSCVEMRSKARDDYIQVWMQQM